MKFSLALWWVSDLLGVVWRRIAAPEDCEDPKGERGRVTCAWRNRRRRREKEDVGEEEEGESDAWRWMRRGMRGMRG